MNLQELDVYKLAILWQSSGGNPQLMELIESELKKRIVANKNFSREYLFKLSKVQNYAINISFIPTSDSYNIYGESVTIDLLLSDSETEELLKNFSTIPPINTSGQLKAQALVVDKLTEKQHSRLEHIGFHTKEILGVLHL